MTSKYASTAVKKPSPHERLGVLINAGDHQHGPLSLSSQAQPVSAPLHTMHCAGRFRMILQLCRLLVIDRCAVFTSPLLTALSALWMDALSEGPPMLLPSFSSRDRASMYAQDKSRDAVLRSQPTRADCGEPPSAAGAALHALRTPPLTKGLVIVLRARQIRLGYVI